MQAAGEVEGIILFVVCTQRGMVRRIMSAHRVDQEAGAIAATRTSFG
jgi:tagatose-1,6-bisphosphate aldolase